MVVPNEMPFLSYHHSFYVLIMGTYDMPLWLVLFIWFLPYDAPYDRHLGKSVDGWGFGAKPQDAPAGYPAGEKKNAGKASEQACIFCYLLYN